MTTSDKQYLYITTLFQFCLNALELTIWHSFTIMNGGRNDACNY